MRLCRDQPVEVMKGHNPSQASHPLTVLVMFIMAMPENPLRVVEVMPPGCDSFFPMRHSESLHHLSDCTSRSISSVLIITLNVESGVGDSLAVFFKTKVKKFGNGLWALFGLFMLNVR